MVIDSSVPNAMFSVLMDPQDTLLQRYATGTGGTAMKESSRLPLDVG